MKPHIQLTIDDLKSEALRLAELIAVLERYGAETGGDVQPDPIPAESAFEHVRPRRQCSPPSRTPRAWASGVGRGRTQPAVATPEPAEQGKTLTLREAIREAARCLPEPFTKQEILNWVTAHAASTLAGAGKSTFGSAICQLRAIGSLADAGERDGEVAFKAGNGLGRK